MISLPYRFVYRDEGDEPSEGALEFRLTYDGKLVSTRSKPEPGYITSKPDHKHEIRKRFHKQLKRLWGEHPGLANWSGADRDPNLNHGPTKLETITAKYGTPKFNWAPLVTPEICVNCKLDILYLRNGARGGVISTADLDNRVKTLLDALKVPKPGEILASESPDEDEDPFFVLLSDDALVTHLSVESDRLLDPTDPALGDVDSRVVIRVKLEAYTGNWHALDLGA